MNGGRSERPQAENRGMVVTRGGCVESNFFRKLDPASPTDIRTRVFNKSCNSLDLFNAFGTKEINVRK